MIQVDETYDEFLHFLLSSIFIIAVIVYTTFLGTFFKSAIGWTEIMAFSTYPLFLVSGYSWPIEAMPNALQLVANLLPSTPYFTVFNKLASQGALLVNIKSEVIHLLFLLLLGYLMLYLRFQYIHKKRINASEASKAIWSIKVLMLFSHYLP